MSLQSKTCIMQLRIQYQIFVTMISMCVTSWDFIPIRIHTMVYFFFGCCCCCCFVSFRILFQFVHCDLLYLIWFYNIMNLSHILCVWCVCGRTAYVCMHKYTKRISTRYRCFESALIFWWLCLFLSSLLLLLLLLLFWCWFSREQCKL